MSDNNTPETANIISIKIFTHAEKYRTPLSAKTYAVWYAYFEGKHADLKTVMDKAMEQQEALPDQFMMELHKRHLDKEQTFMLQAQNHTQRILQDVLKGVLEISDSSSMYEKNLNTYSAGLSRVTNVDQLQTIITAVLKDTKKMSETNHRLQKEFEKAKAQSRLLSQKLVQLEQVASIDTLTGLNNRRAFDNEIDRLIREYRSGNAIFSIIMLDIDFFKRFNDTYGHQVGDDVLKIVGQIIRKGVKGADFPARYGGEEFIIMLPDTNLQKACIVAEQLRIRISVQSFKIAGKQPINEKITTSMGVAEIHANDDEKSVVDRADKALYLAKQSGRNNTKSENDL